MELGWMKDAGLTTVGKRIDAAETYEIPLSLAAGNDSYASR